MRTKTILTLAAISALALPGVAAAQTTAGEIEYQQACAACHGVEAHGDGPVAEYMSVPVPDLTKIAERRNGAFPYQELMQMIDGRNAERQSGPHGTSMPVWGDRFMLDSGSANPIENEINTLGRISSLVDYIYSLQD